MSPAPRFRRHWRAVARMPLLHFLLLGALLFAGQHGLWRAGWIGQEPVVIDAATVARLRADWRRDSGREPDAAALRASIERAVDEELLLRAALRAGLDRSDVVARMRLLQNLRFALPQAEGDDSALLEEAARLGMPRADRVVRQRLVQVMEWRLQDGVRVDGPELDALVATAPRAGVAERRSFRHVFLAQDPGAPDRADQAVALRAELVAGAAGVAPSGDPFAGGERFEGQSEGSIARRFGPDFAAAVFAASAGPWSEPLRSAWGWHLVQVERIESAPPDLQALRRRLGVELLRARAQDTLARALADLRARQPVIVEGLDLQTSAKPPAPGGPHSQTGIPGRALTLMQLYALKVA